MNTSPNPIQYSPASEPRILTLLILFDHPDLLFLKVRLHVLQRLNAQLSVDVRVEEEPVIHVLESLGHHEVVVADADGSERLQRAELNVHVVDVHEVHHRVHHVSSNVTLQKKSEKKERSMSPPLKVSQRRN